tara:strand:+ start:8229 stop:9398 length:1170 start_codon:yes stop_codon:yes gene_type:complete
MKKIIDLGMHPFADTFISKNQLGMSEPVYPLECFLDEKTGHIKLGSETSADERYNLYDYSYTSANSKYSRDHWDLFALQTSERLDLKKECRIVEIGSNDGYLAEQYLKRGFDVLGVDPSIKMAKIASNRGVDTVPLIFNREKSEEIKKLGKADLVVANNVFNHANDPIDFAAGVENILNDNGTFIFEVPYWYNTIVDGRFDQIYHEHVSYFTVKSARELLRPAGLEVEDVELVDYHGGSIRVYASKKPKAISSAVSNFIDKEIKAGLFDTNMYKKFMQDIVTSRNKFLKKLYSLDIDGENPIIGVGAAAKANTFLNFYNLDNTVIRYITDSSKHKQGKYTPLTRIPIVDDDMLLSYKQPYILILSWNISHILKDILKNINPNIRFIEIK